MDYGSCWLYPPPKTCPQTTFPRKYMRGPAVKAGHPFLLLPSTLPKERGDKRQNHRKQNKRTPGKAKTPRPVLEMGLLWPLPYKNPVGGPGPHSSPPTSPLFPSEPSSLSSSSSQDIVTICPTFVLRRKDSTALVALSSPKSNACVNLRALGIWDQVAQALRSFTC